MIREAVEGCLAATGVEPQAIEVGHVGNFAAELYAMQGHLGAFLVDVDPAFAGLPTGRHEAACASGSIALLAATAEIEAGRYDCALRRRRRADEDGVAGRSAATISAPRPGTSARPRASSSRSPSCSASSATSTTGATG